MTKAFSRIGSAKINLALHVTGKRSDGYHLLESLVVFAEYGDRISITPASADQLWITGRYSAELGSKNNNLVTLACAALRIRFPEIAGQHVRIDLEKNLPVASGIGGGSSDAAATLKALSALCGLEIDTGTLCDIGLALGADVPMCVHDAPLIARGIGDRIEPLACFPALDLVLVNPGVPLSTPAVFSQLENPASLPLQPVMSLPSFRSVLDLLASVENDLQPPALNAVPQIGEALNAVTDAGAAFARMSGSGATCFGLFERRDAAENAAAAISKLHPDWFVRATRTKASSV